MHRTNPIVLLAVGFVSGAVVAGLIIAVLLPTLTSARHYYAPPSGYITQMPPSRGMIGVDGWLVPEKMALAVQTALQRLFGDVDGKSTRSLTSWKDRTLSGNDYTGYGGEFLSVAGRPQQIVSALPEGKAIANGLDANQQIVLRVRYWTVRHEGVAAPGRVYLAVEVRKQLGTSSYQVVVDPDILAPIADALVQEVNKAGD